MKSMVAVLLAAGSVALFSAGASAAEMTFKQDVNGYTGTDFAQFYATSSTNYDESGTYGSISYAQAGKWTPLLRFDVSALDGIATTINSATLSLNKKSYGTTDSTYDISVYSLVPANSDWSVDSTGAYLNATNSTKWASGGQFGSKDEHGNVTDYESTALGTAKNVPATYSESYYPFDIDLNPATVMDWINGNNTGFVVIPSGTNLAQIFGIGNVAGGGNGPLLRPELTIVYNEPVPEPMTGSLLLLSGGLLALRRRKA